MSALERLVALLENPQLFAILANAVDDYRATLLDHRDTFADGPEADYFSRSVDQIEELRAALWE
ncbi:hypothetical protein [Microbacterium memoriense]|uniref:Uncharacterized protein n=1 Tax=Microbacterium memoriense TaxID=2978350 RepID=A0ABT2PCD2_9MICO|nr:hypothetical protein [Microbacterium memoriense]MCT9001688.1 hypothetical protein [Microbacterium memoriense]